MTKLALGVEFVENTKLTETVSICVNLCLKSLWPLRALWQK